MSAIALLKLSRALHGVPHLEAAMGRVRAAITENSRYNRAYIHLLHPDGTSFDIVGWVLPNEELVRRRFATIDVSRDALLQMVFAATEPFVIDDLRQHPLADQTQVEYFGNRTAIVVPMFENDAQIGPLVVPTFADQGVMPPMAQELDFFVQVASLLSVVIGRMRAEDERKRLEAVAASSERMSALGRMAGEIAHDFNNLLLAILANIELAADELQDHPVKSLLAEASQAAQRAGGLTRQLLAYSRGQVLNKQVFEVAALLDATVKLALPLLPAEVSLQTRIGDGVNTLSADASQLERVLLNLLLNARDAIGGQGTITLEAEILTVLDEYVATRAELGVGRYLVLSVTDDGQGMDRQTQDHIFEPFFSTKATDRGTGLGLAVVEGVVRQHSGQVHVYSEPGVGTTFKLYLPLDLADLVAPVPRQLPPAALSGAESVLVLDDDEHVRRAVERILVRSGYRVRCASSAIAALAALSEHRIDVLLTDVVLPEIDGVELARQAAAAYPQLRILFMTGYARGKLSELNAPHLAKPFTATELLTLIRQALA